MPRPTNHNGEVVINPTERPGVLTAGGSDRQSARRDASSEAADEAFRAEQAEGASEGNEAGEKKELDAATLCRLLALLADKTRLRILWLLAEGERAVGSMTAELGLPQPTVSHHLAWLRTLHLVSPRRAGKNVFYALGKAARAGADGSLWLLTGDAVVTIGPRGA